MALQWTIARANLDPIQGRERSGYRPVLVVSAEPINEHYDVVLVVPITSRKEGRAVRLGEVMLPAGTGGLPLDSLALCYQTRAIDKSRLVRTSGFVDDSELRKSILQMLATCLDIQPDDLTSAIHDADV